MNDPFVVAEARRWSQQFQSIGSIDERLRYMYLTAFARTPTPAETQAAKEFIARESELLGANNPDDASVWADLAHALINSKEFLYVD